jgi:hypothetical protein
MDYNLERKSQKPHKTILTLTTSSMNGKTFQNSKYPSLPETTSCANGETFQN